MLLGQLLRRAVRALAARRGRARSRSAAGSSGTGSPRRRSSASSSPAAAICSVGLARQAAEEALAGEAPELADVRPPSTAAPIPSRSRASSARRGARRSARGRALLVAGEVEVVLLVELGDEAVGLARGSVELVADGGAAGTRRRIRAGAGDHGSRPSGRPSSSISRRDVRRSHGANGRGSARLRAAHNRGRDDQRARRPGRRARHRERVGADRRRRLGVAARRGRARRTRRPMSVPPSWARRC